MLVLSASSISELFVSACAEVSREGERTAPRGRATYEIMGAALTLTDPRRRFVDLPPARVINPAFTVAEALWIISGSDDPWIHTYNRELAQFTDDGQLLGAYGPRVRHWDGQIDQLERAYRILSEDPDSRRAVIHIGDPRRDHHANRDVPCTLNYRFYLRGNRLQMFVTMRSQDLWRGFCYDIFNATLLQELLAAWLGADLGEYHHQVDSLHLYETDLEAAGKLPARVDPGPSMEPLRVSREDFEPLLTRLVALAPVAGPGWGEFSAVMRSYPLWKSGRKQDARWLLASTPGLLTGALGRWYDLLERRKAAGALGGGSPALARDGVG